jgi:BirA family biotin operon repressor/biotin-[acetyl-CoA-carboxylase] ligase
MLSLLFRPRPGGGRVSELPMCLALGAVEALEALLPPSAEVGLKWPNDVLVDGGKIGGILAEAIWERGAARLIVGIGLNVAQTAAALPPGATSLALAGGPAGGRARLLVELLRAAERHHRAWLHGVSRVEPWSARLSTLGSAVTAETPAGRVAGRAIGVDPDGALLVRLADGSTVCLRAGDVSVTGAGERGAA